MIPDVNVLVAAHHATHLHHAVAAQWVSQMRSSGFDAVLEAPLTLSMPVIGGFLRLVTNSKIFAIPSPPDHAIGFVDWLLAGSNTRLLGQTTEWQHLRTLILSQKLQANHVLDAWLASLALSLGEPFVTFDKGFRQFLPKSLLVLLK
jgi:uncharacterized protein